MKRFSRVLALFVVLVLIFSGCGTNDTASHPVKAKKDVNKNAKVVEFDAVTEICSNDNLILLLVLATIP